MLIVDGLAAVTPRPRAVAIGTFDGVHVGHRAVIAEAVHYARQHGLTSTVLTFDHHPLSVVDPARSPRLLTPLKLKAELIAELGIDELVVLRFDDEVATLDPPSFCRLLVERLEARAVAVGENFTFAAGGSGTAATLKTCGSRSGFETIVVPLVATGGRPMSSSRIRDLLQEGRLDEARELLGRPPRSVGVVVHGFKRGQQLGFPTANVEAETGTMFPGRGVYAARVLVNGSWYRAAVNVGHNPTFLHHGDETGIVHVEAFLVSFSGDIYGAEIRLDFVAKIRDERSFEFVDDLVAQMHRDVAAATSLADPAFDEVGLGI
jgi:riboflavin kinase / FMN adenylyltransferase